VWTRSCLETVTDKGTYEPSGHKRKRGGHTAPCKGEKVVNKERNWGLTGVEKRKKGQVIGSQKKAVLIVRQMSEFLKREKDNIQNKRGDGRKKVAAVKTVGRKKKRRDMGVHKKTKVPIELNAYPKKKRDYKFINRDNSADWNHPKMSRLLH